MIPLFVLALGLGIALTVYEFSPKARSRVDAYARAIRSAHAAQRAADTHLDKARVATAVAVNHSQQAAVSRYPFWPSLPVPSPEASPAAPYVPTVPVVPPTPSVPFPVPPTTPVTPAEAAPAPWPVEPAPPNVPVPEVPEVQDVADTQEVAAEAATDAAVEEVAAAAEANQAAAQNTADAAQSAQTQDERKEVAETAAKVDATTARIVEALRTLGIGQCGVRTYRGITPRVKDALLVKLRAEGMGVTGNNPWNIDTRQYGVRLRAVWDPRASVVKLIVTTGRGTKVLLVKQVTCPDIWAKIDPIMKEVARG